MSHLSETYKKGVALYLPGWKEHNKSDDLLYRRNQNFVQWLGFQTFSQQEAVIAGYTIQALASQHNIPGGVIYSRVKQKSHRRWIFTPVDEWWVTPEEWELDSDNITKWTIKQIKPDPYMSLLNKDILQLTKNSRLKSGPEWEMHGITLIVNNQILEGKSFLEKAFRHYKALAEKRNASQLVSIESRNRVKNWLECPNSQLLSLLRADADKGAELLSI